MISYKNIMKLTIIIFLLSIFSATAQTPVAGQNELTVIKAKGLVDVRNGKLIAPAVVYIRNGKIEKTGKNLDIPASSTVIDLSGKYLLPGLIDAHTHLCHEYQYELENLNEF